jgi:hypothetical protein
MLQVMEIKDQAEISKWLKWTFELPQSSVKECRFRTNAMSDFGEALPPDYKPEPGKNYYLVYKGALEQLLVTRGELYWKI